ncbi:MAG: peptidylprolyl isomerase [Verrucomicrobiales bacterium]|nr:peptidylprolyl isomerase [Verrucomicrobiales bacterium]
MPLCINDEPIPDALLEEEFQVIKAQHERMGAVSCCERDPEFRDYARENVIARVLLNQEAERRHPAVEEAEVTSALAKIAEEAGGAAALCERLGVTALDDPLLRQDVLSGLRLDKLLAEEWGADLTPDEETLRAFHRKHAEHFLTDERVRALHIFKRVEKVEDRETTYQLLRSLRKRARAGEDFEQLALEHTDKEDKLVDLGYFKRGEFMEEFDFIAFSLETGELSPVFASHWGFHLAKIIGREERELKPHEEVAQEVLELYRTEKKQQITRALVNDLKSRAKIEQVGPNGDA